MTLTRNSLAFRLLAGAAIWSVAVLIVGGFVLSAVFRGAVQQAFDDTLSAQLQSLVAATAGDSRGGETVTFLRALGDGRYEQTYSGLYWQIDAPTARLRSRSLFDTELPAEAIGFSTVPGPDGQRLRIFVRDISLPELAAPVRYAIAADLAVVRAQIRRFNGTLIWALAILGAGLLTAMLVQVRFGLQPLRRLRSALADVRLGRADSLAGSYPSEVAPLADELNAVLDSNAEVVARARTHVGNLAHALKTPLAVLTNEAAAHPDAPLAAAITQQTNRMQHQVDHHLVRARAAASAAVIGTRTDVEAVASDLRRAMRHIHRRDAELDIVLDIAPGCVFRGERQDLEEMVGNLLDNACKWAAGQVVLTARRDAATLTISVADDGPGVADDQLDGLLQRGRRLDESMPGSGLGLSIVADIAQLYGGAVSVGKAEQVGLAAVLTLPAAPD